MDLKDFGKQLDGLTSNNSFDNATFLPNDVANILSKYAYWNKEVEALWVQNPQEEDNVKKFLTSFFVTVKTNEKGLFINGNLAVKWDNKYVVEDNRVSYQSHRALVIFLEDYIRIYLVDEKYEPVIMFDIEEKLKKSIKENQPKYISLNLQNVSYWKNEKSCVVQDIKTLTSKYEGKIMADETGLYWNGKLKYSWNDFFPYIYENNNNNKLILVNKTELTHWGDAEYGFHPHNNFIIISNEVDEVMTKENRIFVGCTIKDLPVLKTKYNSLSIQGDNVFTKLITIDCSDSFKMTIDFKWTVNTNRFRLDFFDDYYKMDENGNAINVANQRFKNGTFTIVIDKQISHTLKLASTVFNDKNEAYFYSVNKKIIREIGFAKRLDINLKGDGCDYSIKANELIDLAKTFDKELFDSPKHEMDYYKADFLFEKKQYVDANRYILAAVKEVADDAQYNELAEKIKTKLLSIEAESYNKAQTLYAEKKYEDSVKQLDSIYVVSKKEEIDSLRKKVVDDWVVDLTNKGDSQFKNNNTILAVSNYKKALKLHPEDTELKTKLKKAEASLKAKAKNTAKKVVIGVIAFIVIIVIGSFISDKISEYQYEQERKERIEEAKRYEAKVEEVKKVVIERLNTIYAALSNGKDMNIYLDKELATLDAEACEAQTYRNIPGMYRDCDLWTDSQDYETVKAEVIEFVNATPNNVIVLVDIKDSNFGYLTRKKIQFTERNGEWLVSDFIFDNRMDKSQKAKAKSFLNTFGKDKY